MTQNEFYEHICDLQNDFQNRDLETYLLALLKLVDQKKDENLSAELLLKLIQEAFIAEPAEFNSEWLSIIKPRDQNIMSKKFTNPGINPSFNKAAISDKSGIDYSIAVLQFQISELHKMRQKQLRNEIRYLGIDSETGNRWYNFDPMTNLECGARCILDGGDDNENEFNVSWQTLGELLEMGRIYE